MTWTSLQRDAALPHPAEDLSKDDDLLSWMLVDQLASMPGCKLGVHPQQVGYVGPSYKLEEVLAIVKEVRTVLIPCGHLNKHVDALDGREG